MYTRAEHARPPKQLCYEAFKQTCLESYPAQTKNSLHNTTTLAEEAQKCLTSVVVMPDSQDAMAQSTELLASGSRPDTDLDLLRW